MLRAVLENDFHQDVLQRGLDLAHQWIVSHPEQARNLSRKLFQELGVWKLAKGASWIGIDVQQRTIDSLIEKVESMLANPEHRQPEHRLIIVSEQLFKFFFVVHTFSVVVIYITNEYGFS